MAKPIKRDIKKNNTGSFILIVGDEGAILVKISGGRVIRRVFAGSPDETSTRVMEDVLQESPRYPVTVLFDFMDQSYVRQTLPPVSSFSVGKIIERRLSKDFSPDDIKGYVILDREKTGRKDWNYLMVSLPNNVLLQKWIHFAVERANPFRGIGLIPVEVQPLMKAIEKVFLKDRGKNARPLEWNILVSHNKVGGFRQVVLRNGKLVLTRMAQPVGESSPDVIAGNIEQEIINTLEYLKRLGLQDQALASITVICSEEIKKVLDSNNIKAGENRFLTPYEIGDLLNLKDAAQPNDHFGDIVISSFIAKRKKLILQLHTRSTRNIISFYAYLQYIRLFMILSLLAMAGWTGFEGYDILNIRKEIEGLDTSIRSMSEKLQQIKTSNAKSDSNDINYYTDIMALVSLTDKPLYDAGIFTENLARALQNSALAQRFEWTLPETAKIKKEADTRQVKAEIDLHFTIPREPKSRFAEEARLTLERVKQELPDFTITHSDLPGIDSESKEIKSVIGEDGNVREASGGQTTDILTLTVTGPVKRDGSPNKPSPGTLSKSR